jgi:2-polyprenyl-3-methyl-5-hydroxy-6-metoxy-1,4-benzoquinol methylase
MKHNFKPGLIDKCQICSSKKLIEVGNLGCQPLADDLQPFHSLERKYTHYPLILNLCEKCFLLQNKYIVGDKILYPKNYHYIPGISKDVVDNFKKLSKFLKDKYKLQKNDLIVDVGCNDGSLLKTFRDIGITNVAGVEPTNTIRFAKEKKITSYKSFFDEKIANKIKSTHGKAKIIVTTNVFAHTANLGKFLNAVRILLSEDGFFIIENHYLQKVIQLNQFDTFYHEHLRTYSLHSLKKLLKYYNFNLFYAKTSERYGGNIQAHFSKKKLHQNRSCGRILNNEIKFGLNKKKVYLNFFKRIKKIKISLNKFFDKNKSKKIVGKAFPARASVIINYFNFIPDYIDTIYEQPTSQKINKFVPGTNIKIKSSKEMLKVNPDIVVIFAWHLFKSISRKWTRKGLKAKYINPLKI